MNKRPRVSRPTIPARVHRAAIESFIAKHPHCPTNPELLSMVARKESEEQAWVEYDQR